MDFTESRRVRVNARPELGDLRDVVDFGELVALLTHLFASKALPFSRLPCPEVASRTPRGDRGRV